MEKSYQMSKLMLWIGILILNLKRNQFAAACQIDYFLKTEWDKDINCNALNWSFIKLSC